MTAIEAKRITAIAEKAQAQGVMGNLKSALDSIEEEALRGGRATFFEGYGSAVNLPGLIEALQDLGYEVTDVSLQPAGRWSKGNPDSKFIDRSITVSW